MPEQLKVDIFDAFAEFNDYIFIFKISHDDNTTANLLNAKRYRNIHLLEWVPQVDILGVCVLCIFYQLIYVKC